MSRYADDEYESGETRSGLSYALYWVPVQEELATERERCMKVCTAIKIKASHFEGDVRVIDDSELVGIAIVQDGHRFGIDPHGLLHIEGRMEAES